MHTALKAKIEEGVGGGGGGGGGQHLSCRQIMQQTDFVSRPEESNLKGFSGRMCVCAERADRDVT